MNAPLAIFTPNFTPALCGVGDHTARLLQLLPPELHGIVITGTEAARGPQVFVYPPKNKINWLLRWCRQQPKGLKLLWQYSPYGLHPRGLPWWVVIAMWRLRRAGVRQAIFFHEVQIRFLVPGIHNTWRALQQQIIANICAWLCGGKAATSIPLYQTYFWQKPPRLIPIGANLLPQPGGVVEPHRIVGFANRVYPWLVEALAQLQQQKPTIEIIWLGKSANEAAAKALVKDNKLVCRFTGELPAAALAAMLQSAAIVLLPQPITGHNEGGISLKNGTLAAALGMGKPVIATRGDMTETGKLQHGKVLHLIQQNEASTWLQAITQLLDESAYAEQLSTGAKAFYNEHLTWEKIAPQVWGLLVDSP